MSRLLLRRPPLHLTHRTFSTTSALPISLQIEKNHPEALASTVPPYPYGPARWYKQSDLGLYGGARIRFGNNVGTKIAVKTRRSWQVNVLRKRLFSAALNRYVQVRVAARVLRTIEKCGGLDNYLLGEKEGRIKELGVSGWWLRWAIMQTPVVRKRFEEERARLGLLNGDPYLEKADELEASSEAATEGQEPAIDSAVEEEVIATDDAFTSEQPPDLPPLVFRVDKHKHIKLTPRGWVRTRPDPSRQVEKAKEPIIKYHREQSHFVAKRMEAFKQELKKDPHSQKHYYRGELGREERARVLGLAKREFKRELREVVEKTYEKRRARKEMNVKAKREAERERKEVPASVSES